MIVTAYGKKLEIPDGINGPKMTDEQIDLYLQRINMPSRSVPDLSFLTKLHRNHICTIPYENLDILMGKPLSFDHEQLFDKIIRQKRGGVCSELNTLYNWLLESLGFNVISYSTRIIASFCPLQAQTHRAIGVYIDGEIYITDVGYNYEHHLIPLLLKKDFLQNDGECDYKLTKDEFCGWIMWQNRPGFGWRKNLSFREEPHIDLDFIAPTYFAEKHEDSLINKFPKVSQFINGHFYAVRSGNYLIERSGIEEIIRPVPDNGSAKEVIKEVFALDVDF